MIVRELLTLLGFTVDKASYDKAAKAYDQLTGKLAAQGKGAQAATAAVSKVGEAAKQAGQAAQQAAGKQGLLTSALGMMQRFAATASISGLLKEYVQLGSDANETFGALKELFGEEGRSQVETWSQTMGAAMGRSEFDLQAYAARLGSVLGPVTKTKAEAQAMAQRLSELSVDLASFFNTSDQDAMAALRSGLTGEYESLKRYGVVLNDTTLAEVASAKGIKKKVTQMTSVEKTQLRFEAILARTTAAEGDAIRTRDGFANSSKALQAQLKTLGVRAARTVLPQLEKLLRWAKDGITWFTKVSQETHILEAAMYTLAAVAGILAAEFYAAFILPAAAIAALILLVDDLVVTFEGGDSVIRDFVDGLFGIGTTEEAVRVVKDLITAIADSFRGLDPKGVWESFAAGADNAGFAIEELINKVVELASWLDPLSDNWLNLFGVDTGAKGRATGRGMNAPVASTFKEKLALRQQDQARAINAGVAERNERRREAKYGAKQWSMVPAGEQLNTPMVPFAAGPDSVGAPAAAPAAGGGAPAAPPVALAAPIININGGDTDKVKRVVTETMEAERKKTMAAVARRNRT